MSSDASILFQAVLEENSLADNQMQIVKAQGRKIVVVKRSGKLHAIDNECSHVGGPLGSGILEGNCIVCPWHRLAFDLDTGIAPKSALGDRVAVYEVKTENGKIWVGNRK